MDSIPWEKAQLAAEEKPHCVLGKNHPDGRERMGVDGKATTLLLKIPVGLLLGEAKARNFYIITPL